MICRGLGAIMAISGLDAIGQRNGTDKSSTHHDYLRHYEACLHAQRTPIKALLEVGVYDGASLRMWQEFLPDATIIGLDIDPRCLAFANGNATVQMVDQSDVQQLSRMAAAHGPFDVVIDDGSHIWSHQILTFETLFPHVVSGGLYVIEDMDTSYGDFATHYGQDSTMTAAQYVLKLASYVLGATAANLPAEPDMRMRSFVPEIESITVVRRCAMIRRK